MYKIQKNKAKKEIPKLGCTIADVNILLKGGLRTD
jgi:hypothetical protein